MKKENKHSLLECLSQDKEIIPYRKELNILTGGNPTASILLTQIMYWWTKDNQPFYKYKEPPGRFGIKKGKDFDFTESEEEYFERVKPYKKGDSWIEELGFTGDIFDNAIKRIAHRKRGKGKKGYTIEETKKYPVKPFITYWKTRDNITYYDIINPKGLEDLLVKLYQDPESLFDDLNSLPKQVKQVFRNRKNLFRERGVPSFDSTETSSEDYSQDIISSKEEISNGFQENHVGSDHLNSSEIKKQPLLKSRSKPEPEQKKEVVVPKTIQTIIDFWVNSGLCKHRTNSKVFRDSVNFIKKVMRGNLFNQNFDYNKYHNRKFIQEEIILSIKNFALAATNLDYQPTGDYKNRLKSISMVSFFYNSYSKSDKSLFIKYFENPPEIIHYPVKPIEDKYPPYTKAFKKIYREKILGNIPPKNGFGEVNENKFKKAGIMTAEFFKKHRNKMSLGFMSMQSPTEFVQLVYDALLGSLDGETTRITPGWLCSEAMFNDRLPKYLFNQAIITDSEYQF